MKLIVASLIAFSIVILFLFALFPSNISVTRVMRIRNSKSAVQNKIAHLASWKDWNTLLLFSIDKKPQIQLNNTADSNRLSIGGVTVLLLKREGDTVSTRWQRGNKIYRGDFIFSEAGGQVIVEWTLHFHLRWYPWDKLAGMFYEKEIGPLMEKSLTNLQREMER